MTLALCVVFFQAEDGIRDLTVTGVQTCALPISTAAICRTDNPGTRRRRSPPAAGSSSAAARSDAGARRGAPRSYGRKSRSEEHTSELQSQSNLVCRLLLEKKKHKTYTTRFFSGS